MGSTQSCSKAKPCLAKRGRRRIVGGSSALKEEPSSVQSIKEKIFDVKNLRHQRGKCLSMKLRAHDLDWRVLFYPRGDTLSNESEENVSVYLCCLDVEKDSTQKIKANFTIELGSKSPTIICTGCSDSFQKGGSGWGWRDFAKRDDVLSQCLEDDGTMEITVDIQIHKKHRVWYPKPIQHNNNINSAIWLGKTLLTPSIKYDIAFVLGDRQDKVKANKSILEIRAPVLYSLVEEHQPGEDVPIPNISRSTFKMLLDHAYTGNLPEFKSSRSDVAKEVLKGADRFGLIMLKLQVESEITSKMLTTKNVAHWFLFADSHSCPLLKEKCMEIYKEFPIEFMESSGWTLVAESNTLLQDLMKFAAVGHRSSACNPDEMDVRMLREKLDSAGDDLDGTRPMLIQRLKAHYDDQNDDDDTEVGEG